MKVGLVTLRFDAPGGVETNVRAVARGLREAGDDVRVFASDLHDEEHWVRRSDYPAQVDGVPVHRFPVYKRLIPGVTMPMWTGLMSALASSGVDILHAHSHRYGHVLQCAAVSRATRIPLVVSTHYHPADRRESSKKRALLRVQDHLFGMTAYRQADALVVETELEAQRVAEFAPRERIQVIPPGVDLPAWQHPEQDLAPPGLPKEFVLYAGRIASNKGLHILVEALANIPPEGRPSLVIVGTDWGEQSALVELAARRGISGSVVFLGHLAGLSEYRAVVRRARAFVLPSEWEAFGLVLLEAMAARTPIVATAVGGVPEVLEQGRSGELVPYGDPKALAQAIDRLLQDEARCETLRSEGDRRVRELTWTISVERHRRLYEKILSGTRAGRAR